MWPGMSGGSREYARREGGKFLDPPPLDQAELLHGEAVAREHSDRAARHLIRCARHEASLEVARALPDGTRPRQRVEELLVEHERVLVAGPPGSGTTALVAHLALLATRPRAADPDAVPFVVPVQALSEGALLDEAEIARLSPAAGLPVLRRALAERRALVLVDGLAAAGTRASALARAIAAFADAHPGNRVVVTTRPGADVQPLRELSGFIRAVMVPPLPSPLYAMHRFLGRRRPGRRPALYAARVRELLDAWDQASLPAGSILGRIEPGDRWLLFGRVAFIMHERRVFELPAQDLERHLGDGLLGASWTAGEARLVIALASEETGDEAETRRRARAIVEEIRACPALMVERRPGFFAFADFAGQEILAAAEFIRALQEGDEYELQMLVERRSDPLWHEPIVLAAGLLGDRAGELVSSLLAADGWAAPIATLLAAECAEAAPPLPPRVAKAIARRFAELVPPRNEVHAMQLVDVGDMAAPALIRALGGADPIERACTALVLGELRHEPSGRALVELSSDVAEVDAEISWRVGTKDRIITREPVAFFALTALFQMAWATDSGQRYFLRALAEAPRETVLAFYRYLHPLRLDTHLDPEDDLRDDAPGDAPRYDELVVSIEKRLAKGGGQRRRS
jgi:hypothetical protein